MIRLEDYAHNLHERVLWLVARFNSGPPYGAGSGEWWDNNGGKNYKVAFRIKRDSPSVASVAARRNVASAPALPTIQQPKATSFGTFSPPTSSTVSPIERRSSLLAATTNRLSKFNMSNYAAPSPASKNMIRPPPPPQPERSERRGIPTPPDSPSESNDTTPPRTPELGREFQSLPITRSRLIGGHPATPGPAGYGYGFDFPGSYVEGLPEGSSDELYKAFVARWCFAESPPPGVTGLPGYGLGHEVSVAGTV